MRESLISVYKQIADMVSGPRTVIFPAEGEGGSWSNAYVYHTQIYVSLVMHATDAFVFGTRRKGMTPQE